MLLTGCIKSECEFDEKKQRKFLDRLNRLMLQYQIVNLEMGWVLDEPPWKREDLPSTSMDDFDITKLHKGEKE